MKKDSFLQKNLVPNKSSVQGNKIKTNSQESTKNVSKFKDSTYMQMIAQTLTFTIHLQKTSQKTKISDINNLKKFGEQIVLDFNNNNSTLFKKQNNRRKRTRIDSSHINLLKKAFDENPIPDLSKRKDLSYATGLSQRVVQVWFQNRRANRKHAKKKETNAKEKKTDHDKLKEARSQENYIFSKSNCNLTSFFTEKNIVSYRNKAERSTQILSTSFSGTPGDNVLMNDELVPQCGKPLMSLRTNDAETININLNHQSKEWHKFEQMHSVTTYCNLYTGIQHSSEEDKENFKIGSSNNDFLKFSSAESSGSDKVNYKTLTSLNNRCISQHKLKLVNNYCYPISIHNEYAYPCVNTKSHEKVLSDYVKHHDTENESSSGRMSSYNLYNENLRVAFDGSLNTKVFSQIEEGYIPFIENHKTNSFNRQTNFVANNFLSKNINGQHPQRSAKDLCLNTINTFHKDTDIASYYNLSSNKAYFIDSIMEKKYCESKNEGTESDIFDLSSYFFLEANCLSREHNEPDMII
ncbi:hypothetical protein Zmor_011958 [Zophobas morio]|jgi:hypothetical protein|uniref:Homeobox domain-containing protein n=1 Tax=Zophobas morio TaxID=2755281 RepID=A0AA38LZP0_9CUCU|nr:hypothetical protein Zmor_011958 [Zophobas morio]